MAAYSMPEKVLLKRCLKLRQRFSYFRLRFLGIVQDKKKKIGVVAQRIEIGDSLNKGKIE